MLGKKIHRKALKILEYLREAHRSAHVGVPRYRKDSGVKMTAPGERQAAAAYLRDGKVFLQPGIRIGKGTWTHTTPVLVANEHDRELGALVLLALSKSREEPGRRPLFYKNEHEDPLLKTAGYRSYEAFYDTAKLISIDLEDSGIVLRPTRNGGPGERFLYIKKHIRCQPLEADIETAVRAAFDACER